MSNLGLALSGGGFRATLFHLGVVRFLRDARALQSVTDIASVSGGSILAAHLVLNWDRYNGDEESFAEATSELLKFIRFDLRNHIVRRLPMQLPLRLLARLHVLESRKATPNAILERYYKKQLYGDRCLYELPEQPMLHILATSVSTGALTVFNRNGVYIQQRSNDGSRSFQHVPGWRASIPRVVGASSAFPGFFPPMEITATDLGVREGQFPTEFFTDGGVYDNLGLRAFSWLKEHERNFDQVLVSDAGKPFQILSDAALGVVGQSVRATDILWDRVWQLERENFGNRDGFVFLPITEIVDLSEDAAALHPVVQAEVQSVRTDLDRFSPSEINALAQHGYEVARKLCRQQEVFGNAELPHGPPWAPIPTADSTAESSVVAHSHKPAPTTQLSRRLRGSSRRRIWSTLLDWRDWPSYLYVVIAIILFVLLPIQVYRLHRESQMQETIIEAIKQGDTDLHQVLELVKIDPRKNWVSAPVQEKSEPSKVSYEGIELLEHNRLIDLRYWDPDEESQDRRGLIYLRDRINLRLLPTYQGDGRITFQVPTQAEKIQFRQPNGQIPGVITRITKPVDYYGQKRTIYEFEFDVSEVLLNESVTLIAELLLDYPQAGRVPFVTHTKTNLISVWLLFPEDRPYRTYSLLNYPLDGSEPPSMMDARYDINHPYGSLIGWSVINPEENHVYECRWKFE